jgi:hypothetical protein
MDLFITTEHTEYTEGALKKDFIFRVVSVFRG